MRRGIVVVRLIKQLLCIHDYKNEWQTMVHMGMGKMINQRCSKCDKTRKKII
jgi:hypothetical protein